MKLLVLAAFVLVSACAHQPTWKDRLVHASPQCLELLKSATCEQFVNTSLRMREQLLAIPEGTEMRRIGDGMIRSIDMNLHDIGTCPKESI